jgi:prepilin-type N-terminal cleavage/methylation domain-containing protein
MRAPRKAGFTLVELLAVVLILMCIAGLLLPLLARPHVQSRRSACGNNCGNMIKCCHLYSDAVTNLNQFPLYSESHNSSGEKALGKLFDAYVKDHRVFSCPSKSTDTSKLKRYQAPDESTLQTGFTNYGYDPGHNPTHSTVGVVGDMCTLHAKNGNSTNHGSDGPGQNVAIGAGSVEWWDSPNRQVKTITGRATTDQIFQDNISVDLPEELETCIIK